MSDKLSVDLLFKDHSFEEIETVRDNLANEIDKRTELLKSIVKEKYRHVVDTSDAIQSMKLNLEDLEQSIARFDVCNYNFYQKIKEPIQISKDGFIKCRGMSLTNSQDISTEQNLDVIVQRASQLWSNFDLENLGPTLNLYNELLRLLEKFKSSKSPANASSFLVEDIEKELAFFHRMVKNELWNKIQNSQYNDIGVIANSDEKDIYSLSLKTSLEFLTDKLRIDISDTTYQSQIKRYQQYSYFNTETYVIDENVSDMKLPASGFLQIPQNISIELGEFLFNVCRSINAIAGFSLSKPSILTSLKLTMQQLINVYANLPALIDKLPNGCRSRRALQLYFDLKFMNLLLNESNDLELIDELDSKVAILMAGFENMLDRVELHMVTDAIHNNVLNLNKSTRRLYGLLVPNFSESK